MFTWVLMTVFLAAPGAPPQPEIAGAAFADKTACEMQAVRHNLASSRTYQRCVEKIGNTIAAGAYRPKDAALAQAAPARIYPAQPLAQPSPPAPTAAAIAALMPASPMQPILSAPAIASAYAIAPAPAQHDGAAAGVATAAASGASVAALPTANCNGTPTGIQPYYVRRAAWTPGVNGCDPGERVDRTTADDARRQIAAAGYSRARDLRKGCDNVWHAKVDRGICYVSLAVSPQGVVIQETD